MSAQAVLFDAPGPTARRRYGVVAVLGGLVTVAVVVWVLSRLAAKGNLSAEKWSPFLHGDAWTQYLLPGLAGTLKAAAISIVLAMALGLALGVGRLSENTPLRWACAVFVEFFRAVPVLIMMIFSFTLYAYYNLFDSSTITLAGVVTGLTLYNAAVVAELVRAGVGSLPAGQREAGLSLGLTPGQTMRTILVPQALTAMLPAIVGQLVVVLKDSALGSIITFVDLLFQGQTLGTAQANLVPALIVTAAIYIVINYLLTVAATRVERSLNRRGRTTLRGVPAAPAPVAAGTTADV